MLHTQAVQANVVGLPEVSCMLEDLPGFLSGATLMQQGLSAVPVPSCSRHSISLDYSPG